MANSDDEMFQKLLLDMLNEINKQLEYIDVRLTELEEAGRVPVSMSVKGESITCPACVGYGRIYLKGSTDAEWNTCPQCGGLGKIFQIGKLEYKRW